MIRKACLGWLLMSVSTVLLAQAPMQAGTEKAVDLNIVDGILPPSQRLITVYKGERLRLRITSTTSGEVHLHAYRVSASLQAGQAQEMVLSAFATGRFRLEWHATGAKSPSPGDHHAPALTMLEVRPH